MNSIRRGYYCLPHLKNLEISETRGHHNDGDHREIGPLTVFKLDDDNIRGEAEGVRDRNYGHKNLVQSLPLRSWRKRDVMVCFDVCRYLS